MNRWRVELKGDPYDIERLGKALGEDYDVVEVGGHTTVGCSRWEQILEAADVREEAVRVVEIARNVLVLSDRATSAIACGTVYKLDGKGGWSTWVFASPARATARALAAMVTVNGKETSSPDPNVIRFAGAEHDKDRQLALRFWEEGTWGSLYKALEVIESRTPRKLIIQNGWGSRSEIGRFEHTANTEAGAGPDARHARDNKKPPQKPMLLNEARDLIGGILKAWLLQP